ncbi:uncharacterized protein LOC114801003 [Denticeps clupeoides]|uniref:uncharacterized protein LOC114801003 n=1 Tax=Denticeps clupeoides TaxID=299321 RepID=UPI0010A31D58|nr:uncharacterized protein LOC114801003 [Denticeps clupeoides]
MEEFTQEALAKGYWTFHSSALAPFFFASYKGGGLRPHPLPLLNTAFNLLADATIFNKLDLRQACHLVRFQEGDAWTMGFIRPTGRLYPNLLPRPEKPTSPTSASFCSGSSSGDNLSQEQQAFDELEHQFTTAPVLIHLGPQQTFIVEVEASDRGVGTVLSQWTSSDRKLHPCAFFISAKRNYVGNRELLAVKLALEEWCH